MAVDLFTDSPSSRGMSPRISFSHDLKNSEIVPIEPHIPYNTSLLDYDFDFDVTRRSYDQEPTLADELFENGIILPIQIKKKHIPTILKSQYYSSSSSLLPPLPPSSVSNVAEAEKETEDKQGNNNNNNNFNSSNTSINSKSFWGFTRSKSLNCGNNFRRGLCSLPILSRSKSTGSTTSAKRSLISKDETHHHHHHHHQNVNGKQSSLKNSSSNSNSNSSNHQKPPLKKNYGGSSFNSGFIQVSPVLNVPTGKVFGFGSIFSTNKDKGRKK